MTLAGMINADEEALVCDMAEAYHIFDFRALPLRMAAVLAAGLRENSRIKIKMAGSKYSPEIMILSAIVDRLSILVWHQTEDGLRGINPPKLLLESMTEGESEGFDTVEEFEAAYQKVFGG